MTLYRSGAVLIESARKCSANCGCNANDDPSCSSTCSKPASPWASGETLFEA